MSSLENFSSIAFLDYFANIEDPQLDEEEFHNAIKYIIDGVNKKFKKSLLMLKNLH